MEDRSSDPGAPAPTAQPPSMSRRVTIPIGSVAPPNQHTSPNPGMASDENPTKDPGNGGDGLPSTPEPVMEGNEPPPEERDQRGLKNLKTVQGICEGAPVSASSREVAGQAGKASASAPAPTHTPSNNDGAPGATDGTGSETLLAPEDVDEFGNADSDPVTRTDYAPNGSAGDENREDAPLRRSPETNLYAIDHYTSMLLGGIALFVAMVIGAYIVRHPGSLSTFHVPSFVAMTEPEPHQEPVPEPNHRALLQPSREPVVEPEPVANPPAPNPPPLLPSQSVTQTANTVPRLTNDCASGVPYTCDIHSPAGFRCQGVQRVLPNESPERLAHWKSPEDNDAMTGSWFALNLRTSRYIPIENCAGQCGSELLQADGTMNLMRSAILWCETVSPTP